VEADAAGGVPGHVFISYARVDAARADDVRHALEAAGIRVWWDTASLWPGDNWRMRIRDAITAEALAFVACFSQQSVTREVSYQYEEINLAVEQLRRHRPDRPWLIPVRFDDCQIPDIGGDGTLASLQRVDLFGAGRNEGYSRLVTAVRRILGEAEDSSDARETPPVSSAIPMNPIVEKYDNVLARSTASIYRIYGRILGSKGATLQALSFSFTRDNPQYQAKVLMRQSPEWAAAVLMTGHIHPKHVANILDEMEANSAKAVLEQIPPVRRQEITVHMKRPG
jgi:TIR domain